ncbi:MAG: hypothetical protein ACKVZ6_04925 [Kineosporiaceae bacterium]|jgi:hypothetical protein
MSVPQAGARTRVSALAPSVVAFVVLGLMFVLLGLTFVAPRLADDG